LDRVFLQKQKAEHVSNTSSIFQPNAHEILNTYSSTFGWNIEEIFDVKNARNGKL